MNAASPSMVAFSPILYLRNVSEGISFYQKALGAVELRRWSNGDGSVHVAELSLEGTLFFVHEESHHGRSPGSLGGTSTTLAVFVPDPDAWMTRALAAGAREISPAKDYDYGYRQGDIEDPFGHLWTLQKRIG